MTKTKEEKLEEIIVGTEEKEKENIHPIDALGLGNISEQLTGKDKLKFISYISDIQASDYSILYAINTKLKSDLLAKYIESRLSLAISVKGRGRNDLVKLTENFSLGFALLLGSGNEENKGSFLKKVKDKI
jgi:hypothetical protein